MAVKGSYRCHGVTEICPGLFLSGAADTELMEELGVEVLFRLTNRPQVISVEERRYITPDFGVMPEDKLEKCVSEVVALLGEGKKVGIFCTGGHGRTGYVAACVLWRLGFTDPIAMLRKNYCERAVESYQQVCAIADFCGKEHFKTKYRYTVEPYGPRVSER